jgi:hypothetical protein
MEWQHYTPVIDMCKYRKLTKSTKSDKIFLLSESNPDNNAQNPQLFVLRLNILSAMEKRLTTAQQMDIGLIAKQDTSDRYVISVTDRQKEQVREACSRLLLMPRRKELKQGGVDKLFIYLPDDVMEEQTEVFPLNRAYVRFCGPLGQERRYLVTPNQLAPYDTIEDISVDVSVGALMTEINYFVPKGNEYTEQNDYDAADLLTKIVDKSLDSSYYLKSQNIRI